MISFDRFENILRDEPGVYLFTNFLGTRFYIGTSSNVKHTVIFQLKDLVQGMHFNSVLQQFFNELEGDIHLQVIYTSDLAEAKVINMRMASDTRMNVRIMNPYFRKMSRRERDMMLTLARKYSLS